MKLIRKPYKMGPSRALVLPIDWCRYYGERVDHLTIFENGLLILAPQGMEGQAERLMQSLEGENQKVIQEVKNE
jgi:hypothetical protein